MTQAHDITARRAAEEEIVRLNQDLGRRVRERTLELSRALEGLTAETAERRRLESEILGVNEREQSRIGQDLHDNLGQELAGIALLAKALSEKLALETHSDAEMAALISRLTSGSIESVRRLARGLYPVELQPYGLLKALEELALHTKACHGVECEVRSGPAPPIFERSVEIHLYRIVQESVCNAIRHGRATRVVVEARRDSHVRLLSIHDNGPGLISSSDKSLGLGLELMHYRATLIGATVQVSNHPEGGCLVLCRLPEGADPL